MDDPARPSSDTSRGSSYLGNVAGRRAVVMGIGLFGGGEAAARYLRRHGADVLATDLQSRSELGDAADRLARDGIECRFGEHLDTDFEQAELLIVNPAVPHPWDNPFIRSARDHGARILTEIQLALGDRDAANLIGITGSAGKSTTTAMTAHALAAVRPDRQVVVAGNFGGSLLDDVPSGDASIVAELSSFMLHWMAYEGTPAADHVSTGVCTVTNLTANHLDWHESFDHYAACKNAIRNAAPGRPRPVFVEPTQDGSPDGIEDRLELVVPGAHNRRNAALAVRLALEHLRCREGLESDATLVDALIDSLKTFRGLPHRLELVGTWNGIRFLDDSKATTPEATALAVAACGGEDRVHLIAGGYDKGVDLAPIRRLGPRLAGLYAIGQTARTLVGEDDDRALGDLRSAMREAIRRARPGETILLSPGCASWDQFPNFQARGKAFQDLVGELSNRDDSTGGDDQEDV